MIGGPRGTVFRHATKVDAAGTTEDFWMLIDGDRIVGTGTGKAPDAVEIVDGRGMRLTPGFIDLHAHGAGGHSFDDGPRAIRGALEIHRAHGTTRSVISLVANPLSQLHASLAGIAELAVADPLILGSHLEGPYLAVARRGAHNRDHLREPSVADLARLIEAASGTLRQVTIAPELPGALEAIDVMVAEGIVVAIGHTDSDYDLARTAFDRGATLVTHAFNAMPGILPRAPGPAVAALGDDRVTLELILDGRHVHPESARIAFAAASDRIALVTDSMAATGNGDGDYTLGSLEVEVRDGLALVAGTDTIAGSTLTLDSALRRVLTDAQLDPPAAVAAVTLTPARALGLDRDLGLLAPGYVADAVLLDDEWRVQQVWAAGRRIR